MNSLMLPNMPQQQVNQDSSSIWDQTLQATLQANAQRGAINANECNYIAQILIQPQAKAAYLQQLYQQSNLNPSSIAALLANLISNEVTKIRNQQQYNASMMGGSGLGNPNMFGAQQQWQPNMGMNNFNQFNNQQFNTPIPTSSPTQPPPAPTPVTKSVVETKQVPDMGNTISKKKQTPTTRKSHLSETNFDVYVASDTEIVISDTQAFNPQPIECNELLMSLLNHYDKKFSTPNFIHAFRYQTIVPLAISSDRFRAIIDGIRADYHNLTLDPESDYTDIIKMFEKHFGSASNLSVKDHKVINDFVRIFADRVAWSGIAMNPDEFDKGINFVFDSGSSMIDLDFINAKVYTTLNHNERTDALNRLYTKIVDFLLNSIGDDMNVSDPKNLERIYALSYAQPGLLDFKKFLAASDTERATICKCLSSNTYITINNLMFITNFSSIDMFDFTDESGSKVNALLNPDDSAFEYMLKILSSRGKIGEINPMIANIAMVDSISTQYGVVSKMNSGALTLVNN